jgi:hypothetical protein
MLRRVARLRDLDRQRVGLQAGIPAFHGRPVRQLSRDPPALEHGLELTPSECELVRRRRQDNVGSESLAANPATVLRLVRSINESPVRRYDLRFVTMNMRPTRKFP